MSETMPCNDPNQDVIPKNKKEIFEPELRRQHGTGCKITDSEFQIKDKRFREIGLAISEKTLHESSPVKNLLLNRVKNTGGMKASWLNNAARVKNTERIKAYYRNDAASNMIKTWIRPTIGWSIECEGSTKRNKAYMQIRDISSLHVETGLDHREWPEISLIFSVIAGTSLLFICGFYVICEGFYDFITGKIFVVPSCCICFSYLSMIGPMVFFIKEKARLRVELQKLETFQTTFESTFNNCTDTHTHVNVQPAIDLATSSIQAIGAIPNLAIISVTSPAVLLLIVLLGAAVVECN